MRASGLATFLPSSLRAHGCISSDPMGLEPDLLEGMVLHSPNPALTNSDSVAEGFASERNRMGIGEWVLRHCTVHHLFLLHFTPLSLSCSLL